MEKELKDESVPKRVKVKDENEMDLKDDLKGGLKDDLHDGLKDDLYDGLHDDSHNGLHDDSHNGLHDDSHNGLHDDSHNGLEDGEELEKRNYDRLYEGKVVAAYIHDNFVLATVKAFDISQNQYRLNLILILDAQW
jgi:hypothetical protein